MAAAQNKRFLLGSKSHENCFIVGGYHGSGGKLLRLKRTVGKYVDSARSVRLAFSGLFYRNGLSK
jgi:hypothetical protein